MGTEGEDDVLLVNWPEGIEEGTPDPGETPDPGQNPNPSPTGPPGEGVKPGLPNTGN